MQAEGEGDFPYRCPRGSRTVCLLCSDIALVVLSCSGFWAMSVEEICQRMTVDEAMAVVVEDGICKGWTMGQVLERRRGSLKFFTSPFCEFRNTIKAAATLLFRELEQEKAG